MNNYNLIKLMVGLELEYLRKKMELCLIMSIFAFMMIYLIEFNQLIKIEISCGGLYQMNQMKMNLRVKQHRYTMKRSKIRRVLITNIKTSILFRERGKKTVDCRKNSFDNFSVMIVDPTPKLTTAWETEHQGGQTPTCK